MQNRKERPDARDRDQNLDDRISRARAVASRTKGSKTLASMSTADFVSRDDCCQAEAGKTFKQSKKADKLVEKAEGAARVQRVAPSKSSRKVSGFRVNPGLNSLAACRVFQTDASSLRASWFSLASQKPLSSSDIHTKPRSLRDFKSSSLSQRPLSPCNSEPNRCVSELPDSARRRMRRLSRIVKSLTSSSSLGIAPAARLSRLPG